MSNKKKLILGIILGAFIGSLVSITYAFFVYQQTSANQELITGNIYMTYKEKNNLLISNMFPSSTYSDYFEFTIEGTNTTTNKDIYYDINLLYGDSIQNKERITDKYLKFKLVEVVNNEEVVKLNDKSYNSINNQRIYVDTIEKGQTVNRKYRLYVRIDENLIVYGGDPVVGGIDQDDWDGMYGSIKVKVIGDFNEKKVVPVNNCTYNGTFTQGAEYVNGQYTYRYMQEGTYNGWQNITSDGWGVKLTNRNSTDPVTTEICTSINNKPIVSMSFMFSGSRATSLDLSSFDTSNVTNMYAMFSGSRATSLDLSSFDTSNVINMSFMFQQNYATSLDLSSFDTSNVTSMDAMFSGSQATSLDLSSFDTLNVTSMEGMFSESQATSLDLSSFDTFNVTYMGGMFSGSQATNVTVKDDATALDFYNKVGSGDLPVLVNGVEKYRIDNGIELEGS